MTETSYVYGLIDPRTDELKYIGKSNDVFRRTRYGHEYNARTGVESPVAELIRGIWDDGSDPDWFILEEVLVEEVFDAESFWYQYFTYIGADLLNRFDPRSGVEYHLEKSKERLREINLKSWEDPQIREKRSQGISDAWTPERRELASRRMKGEGNPCAKFLDEEIAALREEFATTEYTLREISSKWGASIAHVYAVVIGESRRSAGGPILTRDRVKTIGGRHRRSSLTEEQVLEIRRTFDSDIHTYTEFGRRYDVTYVAISNVVNYRTWKHIQP